MEQLSPLSRLDAATIRDAILAACESIGVPLKGFSLALTPCDDCDPMVLTDEGPLESLPSSIYLLPKLADRQEALRKLARHEPATPPPFTDDTVRAVLEECVRYCDARIQRVTGKPLYVSIVAWPSNAHELVAHASNSFPAEREQIAQAMIELLIRWGHLAA